MNEIKNILKNAAARLPQSNIKPENSLGETKKLMQSLLDHYNTNSSAYGKELKERVSYFRNMLENPQLNSKR